MLDSDWVQGVGSVAKCSYFAAAQSCDTSLLTAIADGLESCHAALLIIVATVSTWLLCTVEGSLNAH